MNKNIRLFLLLIFSMLLAAAAFFSGRGVSARNSAHALRKHFPGFRSEEVRSITISWRKVQTTLRLKNGHWVIQERNDLPASSVKVAELLTNLSSVTPVKELLPADAALFKQLHLNTEDRKDDIPGLHIVLKDSQGKNLFDIILGRGHFVTPEPGLPPAERPEGRYAALNGRVYLLPRVFEQIHPLPGSWITETFLPGVSGALLFSCSDGENNWCVSRRSTNLPYELLYPSGKTLDMQKLSVIAGILSRHFAGDYFTGDASKLKFDMTFRMFTPDGFRYAIEFANLNNDADCIRLFSEFQENKVLPQTGESAQALSLRRKKLKVRADAEKRILDGKYFLVGKEFRKSLSQIPAK